MLQIKNLDTKEPILEIYEPIGLMFTMEGAIGVSGSELATALNYINSLGNKDRIKLYINSDGGNVSDGMSMYSAIKSSKVPVDVVNVGVCVSMAGVVLQAGAKRQMVKWGQMMIHPPAGGAVTDLVALKETLVRMLCEASGIPEAEMEDLMDKTSWLNAETCLEMKLIDEIIDISVEETIPSINKSTAPATAYKSMLQVVNSLNPKKKNQLPITKKKMDKITAYLGLPFASDEIDALNSIKERDAKSKLLLKGIYNARKAAKGKDDEDPDPDEEAENALDALLNQVNAMKEECKNLKASLDAKTEECDTLKNEKKTAEDTLNEKEAEDVINQAVNTGKITKDAKAHWIGLYIASPETTNELLKGIGFIKKNTPIPAKAPTHDQVTQTPTEKRNGVRSVNKSDTENGKDPFKEKQKEMLATAAEATKNYKNKYAK